MRILILGGGYAGILTAKALEKELGFKRDKNITLIDKNPYHTLLTQLHEVAAGRVSPSAVRIPYDMIFEESVVSVVQDEIKGFDFERGRVLSDSGGYGYDYLIIATGSRPDFFGIPGVERYGYKLWSYKEAVAIRSMIYDRFHLASETLAPSQRRRLLSFVIAGGGFTGVELAGDLASRKKALCRHFDVDASEVSVYLVEAMPEILNVLAPSLRKKSRGYLEKMGVKVLTDCAIGKVEADSVFLKSGDVLEGCLIWTAGIKGNPYILKSDISYDEKKHWINVNAHLQSLSHDNVFCVGDSLFYEHQNRPVPKVVETCMQSATLVAKNIRRIINGKEPLTFHPKYRGSMVSIGPFYGVAQMGSIKLKWLFATAAKHFAHIHYMHTIGGLKLGHKYIKDQFVDRIFFREVL